MILGIKLCHSILPDAEKVWSWTLIPPNAELAQSKYLQPNIRPKAVHLSGAATVRFPKGDFLWICSLQDTLAAGHWDPSPLFQTAVWLLRVPLERLRSDNLRGPCTSLRTRFEQLR